MSKNCFFLLCLLILLLSLTITLLAQDDVCPALVQTALEYTDEVCSTTERNQACYGNLRVEAVLNAGADLEFDSPGDRVGIADIQTLNLSAMATPDEWGVALMQVQANLPDTLPGQNVTMLIFGDVTIENQQGQQRSDITKIEVVALDTTNIRTGPGLGFSVFRLVPREQKLLVDGRDETGNWLRVILDEGTNIGWVSIVAVSGENASLPVVQTSTPINILRYRPMQAFYFQSGISTALTIESHKFLEKSKQ